LLSIGIFVATRPIANPNLGFQKQLQDWYETERWQSVSLVNRLSSVPYNDGETIELLVCWYSSK